ncbi:MAG: 2-hydroxymuconate tautomerase [Bacillota bacterium]
MPFIQINMLEGRTVEQKRGLAKLVTKSVSEALGIAEQNVTIIIKDVPKTNFSQGGTLATDKQ